MEEIKTTEQKKRFCIFGVELVYLVLFGIGVAFLGWIGENAFKYIVSGNFDSRFHILPFISPYALVPFAFHVALRDPDDVRLFGIKIFKEKNLKNAILSNIISFFSICAVVFLGELAVGNMWDAFFGVELWNYNSHPLHITQYTSVISTFGFGSAAYAIFRFIHTPVLRFMRKKVNFKAAKTICLTLGILIALDTVRMMLSIVIIGEAPNFWEFRDGKFSWLS